MAGNLTAQVRNIAEVTTAVAKGDLSKKIAVDVKGEILELKNTINTMVDQLGSFASEVTESGRFSGVKPLSWLALEGGSPDTSAGRCSPTPRRVRGSDQKRDPEAESDRHNRNLQMDR